MRVSAGGPPSGVVTFLFTDIEGSTRRWEADAEAMRAALLEHDQVLRTTIEARILNRVDSVLLGLEQVTGKDGIRVTRIRLSGRSRNLSDPGWRTTTWFATYSILYDETAV